MKNWIILIIVIASLNLTACLNKKIIPEDLIKEAKNNMDNLETYEMNFVVEIDVSRDDEILPYHTNQIITLDNNSKIVKIETKTNIFNVENNITEYIDQNGSFLYSKKEEDTEWQKATINNNLINNNIELLNDFIFMEELKYDVKDTVHYRIKLTKENANDYFNGTYSFKEDVPFDVYINKKEKVITQIKADLLPYVELKDASSFTITKINFNITINKINEDIKLTLPI